MRLSKRNHDKPSGEGASGLTLVEVLISMAITAVLAALMLSALRLGYRSEQKGLERAELSQRMRIISSSVGRLIRGAYPYIVKVEEGKRLYFKGTSEMLGLVTTSADIQEGSIQDRAGLLWVELYADGDGLKIRKKIYYAKDAFEQSGGRDYVIDPLVKGINFSYLDWGVEEDMDEYWSSMWDGDEVDYLPSAVRVSVVLRHGGRDIEMPPFIAAIRTGRPEKKAASGFKPIGR